MRQNLFNIDMHYYSIATGITLSGWLHLNTKWRQHRSFL